MLKHFCSQSRITPVFSTFCNAKAKGKLSTLHIPLTVLGNEKNWDTSGTRAYYMLSYNASGVD